MPFHQLFNINNIDDNDDIMLLISLRYNLVNGSIKIV